MKKKIVFFLLGLLVLGGAGFVAWASATNPVLPQAEAALRSDAQVQVTGGDWLVFRPTGMQPEMGYIFYPGGKVNYRAYAPYARAVARAGYLVVVPRMPLNLAVLDAGEAGKVMAAFPQVTRWVLGGHSLGGSMAANFAAGHQEAVDGIVFLASYPAGSDSLAGTSIPVLSIYATQDGLATAEKINASHALLPADTQFIAIAGGNHAQFGWYGIQPGDGTASISREAQQAQTVAATTAFFKQVSAGRE